MRTRELQRRQREILDGITICTAALTRFPGDAVYTRSLRIWEARGSALAPQIAAAVARQPATRRTSQGGAA